MASLEHKAQTPLLSSVHLDLGHGEQQVPVEQSQHRNSDILRVDKEPVISTSKSRIIKTLVTHIESLEDRKKFVVFGKRIASSVRAWYRHFFDELLHVYEQFDPQDGRYLLEMNTKSVGEVEEDEFQCLQLLLAVLHKSNFKLLSDAEVQVALQGTYLLGVPVKVDMNKLDVGLFSRFMAKHPLRDPPKFAKEYLIFRRGVGVDSTKGYFIFEKINLLLGALWRVVLWLICVRPEKKEPIVQDIRRGKEDKGLEFKRVRLENLDLSFKNIFTQNTIQEPTFERIILIYRPSTRSECPSPLGERSICLKQFWHLPMADLEIVLPEKMTPGLTPVDWVWFLITVLGGLAALLASVHLRFSMTVLGGIAIALGSYMVKVYYAWSASMACYAALLQQSVYEKQLDSGRATLLHLCSEMEDQEFKESLVAYYVLWTAGSLTLPELEERCGALMDNDFRENVKFDAEDAVRKLERMGIVTEEYPGKYSAKSLEKANSLIGHTTDEKFGITDFAQFVEWSVLDSSIKLVVSE